MKKFRVYLPLYAGMKLYGAVAFFTSDSRCQKMAERLGFFVIKATGNSASIINPAGFVPKEY